MVARRSPGPLPAMTDPAVRRRYSIIVGLEFGLLGARAAVLRRRHPRRSPVLGPGCAFLPSGSPPSGSARTRARAGGAGWSSGRWVMGSLGQIAACRAYSRVRGQAGRGLPPGVGKDGPWLTTEQVSTWGSAPADRGSQDRYLCRAPGPCRPLLAGWQGKITQPTARRPSQYWPSPAGGLRFRVRANRAFLARTVRYLSG